MLSATLIARKYNVVRATDRHVYRTDGDNKTLTADTDENDLCELTDGVTFKYLAENDDPRSALDVSDDIGEFLWDVREQMRGC